MMESNANEYLRTRVMTASPAELRLMLLEGAVRFAEQAQAGLEEKDFEKSYLGSKKCRGILTELISSLSPEIDQTLCERLCSLYTYIYSELVAAMSDRDPERLGSIIPLLEFERETWVHVLAQLAEEKAAAAEHAAVDRPEGDRIHLAG